VVQQAERIMRWMALAFCALAVLSVTLGVMAHFGMLDAFLMPQCFDPGRP
jgi:hypothetical protein